MDSTNDFCHDEEGYCGVTYDDFVERCPNFQGNELDIEGDFHHPFGYTDPVDLAPFLKNVSRTATRVLSQSKFLNKTRRMFWGYFLGAYDQNSLSDLSNYIKRSRKDYWEKVDKHNRKNSIEQIQSLDPQIFHPLAPPATNPWAMSQKNKELMEEIWQDVQRTYQERSLFQNNSVRKTLQRILFVWSMEHDYISYKQGMNELLAIIYIVCYRDQDKTVCGYDDQSYNHFKTVFSESPKDIEADSYTLFNSLMTMEFQVMYDNTALKHFENKKVNLQNQPNPLIARCNHIYNELLKECDFNLYAHLKNIELEPHLFMIRWIRLVFSREFNVNETLNLWDFLLSDYYFENKEESEPPKFTFQSIDFFSVAMIIFVKQNLLENDINFCLQRLFKYPPIEDISLLTKKALEIKMKFLKYQSEEQTQEESDKFHDAFEYYQEKTLEEFLKDDNFGERLQGNSYGETLQLNSSKDVTPKSVVIKLLDDTKFADSGNDSSDQESYASNSTSTPTNLKKELVYVASEISRIYEKALKNNDDQFLTSLQNVHSHVSKIITNLDTLTL